MNNSSTQISQQKESQEKAETQLNQKTTIEFQEKILDFMYYQNHLICKAAKKVIVINTLTKEKNIILVQSESFVLEFMPPYLFALIQGKFITLYDEDSISKTKEAKPPITLKISKLEPLTICKFNKGYILGGYNRGSFPASSQRTNKRLIYFIEKLYFNERNKPDQTLRIKDSEYPISKLFVQNPYLLVYARPTFYLISLQSKQTLITFEKEALNFIILEGRFAFSSLNGIGISMKNTIFTFDVERFPLYGVQVTQHLYTAECVCRQKSGRIFGGHSNLVFEYNPIKKYSKCWAMYPQGEYIVSISCSPTNNLLVLHMNRQGKYSIDVFGIQ